MRVFAVLFMSFLALAGIAVHRSFTAAEEDAPVTGPFGDPVPGLSSSELARFERGRSTFLRRFTRAQGLGPHFNASSCGSCHEDPEPGGSAQRYRDFFLAGRQLFDGSVGKVFPDCTAQNATTQRSTPCLPSLVVPHYGPKGTRAEPVASAVEHPSIPPEADVVARRNAPPLFGVGLFRLVSDEEILSREDPGDHDLDGISGRANRISREDGAIGRFGYKCQTASIEAFNRGALHNQMGITSDSTDFRVGAALESPRRGWIEELLGVRAAHAQVVIPSDRVTDFDGVPDPEIARGLLLDLIFFQEHLAAPRRGTLPPAARRGEATFERLGCVGCHTPSLETSRGLIHSFTDLLLHDMGPDLADGIVMELAGGEEFRTQPLWGVRHHAPFLHDGRADTLDDAVRLHGGEATSSRDRYLALDESEREDLLRFLESL